VPLIQSRRVPHLDYPTTVPRLEPLDLHSCMCHDGRERSNECPKKKMHENEHVCACVCVCVYVCVCTRVRLCTCEFLCVFLCLFISHGGLSVRVLVCWCLHGRLRVFVRAGVCGVEPRLRERERNLYSSTFECKVAKRRAGLRKKQEGDEMSRGFGDRRTKRARIWYKSVEIAVLVSLLGKSTRCC